MDTTFDLSNLKTHDKNVRHLFDRFEEAHKSLGILRPALEQQFVLKKSKYGDLNLASFIFSANAEDYYMRAIDNFKDGEFLDAINLLILGWFLEQFKSNSNTEPANTADKIF